jgi:hypothetical protein
MSTTVRTDTAAKAPTRGPGTTLAASGALATSVALALAVVADPGALPFVAPPLIIGGVVAALAWFTRGLWSTVLAGVWGVAALAQLPATPIPLAMTRPDSLLDFIPAWLFIGGAVTAIAGAAVAIARRGTDGPVAVERRWLGAGGAVLAVLVAISGVASVTTDTALTAEERAGAIEVVMVDSAFEPDALDLPAGEVRFAVRNEGKVLHTFTIDDLGIDEVLAPGQEVLVTATIPADSAPIVFYCSPHSHGDGLDREGMVGLATIQ